MQFAKAYSAIATWPAYTEPQMIALPTPPSAANVAAAQPARLTAADSIADS